MRRSASEIIRNLEQRIARLEKQALMDGDLTRHLLNDIIEEINDTYGESFSSRGIKKVFLDETGFNKGENMHLIVLTHPSTSQEYYVIVSEDENGSQNLDEVYIDEREAKRDFRNWK